ncbi:AGC-kinase C-terminal [Penicillium verhagenii]|nr:AGC-kinase C-terminal [Penicillium verhagenii]
MAAAQNGTVLHGEAVMKPNSSLPEDETPDHIGSNGSTPTGIATPQPDPADKRLPSIMHNYFQVGSFSGDRLSLPRLWPCVAKPFSEQPHPTASSESFVVLDREEGSDKIEANLPTPPHSLLQSDEMDLSSSPDMTAGSIFNTLKKYLIPHDHDSHSRRQTSLPVSSVSDDPVLATHFSNPSLPAQEASPPTDTPLLDHEKPHVSISSENLTKLTGTAPDAVCLKNTPPLTPRTMSNEDEKKTPVTSAPRLESDTETEKEETKAPTPDSETDEITLKLDQAFPRQPSPQNGPPVGPLKGKLTVKISEGRGLRPSVDPYVVCVFEWNEYISKGTKDGEEEQEENMRRQIESDVAAGRPMAIPMRSRQSSNNSAFDADKGKSPVTDPHWDHAAVFDVLGDQSEVDVTVYDRHNQEAFLGHVRLGINLKEDHSRLEGWFPLVARGAGDNPANFKGFTFVNESSMEHHVKDGPEDDEEEEEDIVDEDTILAQSWRSHRPTNSSDLRSSGVKTSDAADPGIFNVDENF